MKSKRPNKPLSNVQIMRRLMEDGSPLRQIFIMDALVKMTDLVSASDPDGPEYKSDGKSMGVDPHAWVSIAKELKRELAEYYGWVPNPAKGEE